MELHGFVIEDIDKLYFIYLFYFIFIFSVNFMKFFYYLVKIPAIFPAVYQNKSQIDNTGPNSLGEH